MSLEHKIAELTSAVKRLTEILDLRPVGINSVAAGDPMPQEKVQEEQAPNVKSESASIQKSVEPPVSTGESSSPALTYNEVAKAIVALSKIDLQKAKDVLSRFGVKNGKELKPEQWADAKALAESVLAGGDV